MKSALKWFWLTLWAICPYCKHPGRYSIFVIDGMSKNDTKDAAISCDHCGRKFKLGNKKGSK